MATRIVEGKKPYTGGQAIEIDENKVISLRLRDENNLIIYDSGDDEIYVDLQLPDEITPTDAFPVGITTGRVVVDNGWDKAGTIICAKTTSGDVIKLVYADEGTLWIDNGTGTFKQIYFKSDVDAIITTLTTYINTELAKKQNGVASTTAPSNPSEGDLWYDTTNDEMKVYDGTQWNSIGTGGTSSNTKTFTISSTSDLTNAQAALDWYLNGGNPILYHERGYTSIPMPCTYHLRETRYRNSNYEYVFVSPAGNWDMESLEWASESDTIFHCIGLSVADVNDEPGDTVLSIREFDIKGSDYFAKKADASKIEYVTQAEYTALLPGAESDNKHYFIYSTSGRLPSAYQEVEYIQSSGSQYFIIGTQFKTDNKVVIDLELTQTGGDYIPLGINNSTQKYAINAYGGYFKVVTGGSSWSNTISENKNRHTFEIDKNIVTVDGTSYSSVYNNVTIPLGFGVFAYNEHDGTVGYGASMKLYKLDIYDASLNHLYDLVPCYRIADGVIGMYDIVNQFFYTNAGSGVFTKGGNV